MWSDLFPHSLHCVQGCYPKEFLKAWDTFDKQKGSENDRPGQREKNLFMFENMSFKLADGTQRDFSLFHISHFTADTNPCIRLCVCVSSGLFYSLCLDFFEKDQLFIILEFEFGGSDLENSNGTVGTPHQNDGCVIPPLCSTMFCSDVEHYQSCQWLLSESLSL